MGFSGGLKPRNGKSLQMRGDASSLCLENLVMGIAQTNSKTSYLVFPIAVASIEVTAKTPYTLDCVMTCERVR